MPYVTSIERRALKRGYEAGLAEGLAEGQAKGLREGILLALEAKFGAAGRGLRSKLRAITDAKALRRLARAVNTAESLDDVRRQLPAL